MKTSMVIEEPETLYKIIGVLVKYKYNRDYSINCENQYTVLNINNEDLRRKLFGEKDKAVLIIKYGYRNLCISTRLLDISYAKYMDELIASIILYKLLSCSGNYIYVFIIDSLSRNSLLTGYYMLKYMNRYNCEIRNMDLYDLGNYVLKLIMFKEISDRVKELGRMLRIRYDQRMYDEYIVEVEKLDKITQMLTSLWEKNKELFDNLLNIINEDRMTSDDLIKNIIADDDLLLKITKIIDNHFNELARKISGEYGIGYKIIYVDKIVPIRAVETLRIDFKLSRLSDYLRKSFGCDNLLIINGEEYEILRSISNLNFISLNISTYF